jgi:hypothetical protein
MNMRYETVNVVLDGDAEEADYGLGSSADGAVEAPEICDGIGWLGHIPSREERISNRTWPIETLMLSCMRRLRCRAGYCC